MKRKKYLVIWLAPLLLVLFMGAASASEKKGDTTGVTDKTIKIGSFFVLTGPASPYGIGGRNTMELVFNEINAKGGINGRKLEWIVEDDACSPSKAVAAVKKLITRDKVFALYGGNCSNSTVNVIPLVKESKVPLYVPFAISERITKPFSKYVFRTNVASTMEGPLMVDFAMDNFQPKRMAILYQSEEAGITSMKGVRPRLVEKYKMSRAAEGAKDPILIVEAHKFADTDMSSQLMRIKKFNPDVIFLHTFLMPASIILRQANELGINAKFVCSIPASNQIMDQLAGKEAVWGKYYAVTPLIDIMDGPKFKSFRERYKKAYPTHSKRPGIPGIHDGQGYGSVTCFVEGLRRAGSNLTRESFIAGLESMKDFAGGGYPPVSFSPTDHDGLQGIYFHTFTKDGQRKFIDKYYPWKGTWRP
jgi:branched-chain amino acid transport system substrate-binding protein